MTSFLKLPKHIAIIMDGNGRWAKQRRFPRIAGHRAGVASVKRIIKACAEHNIEILTLFAFSSENWQRPITEVNGLMQLFLKAFKSELTKLHENNIQVRFIGDHSRFNPNLQQWIQKSEEITKKNTGLKLVIAANYGGQWDLTQALQKIGRKIEQGTFHAADINPDLIAQHLSLADLPNPDLFIRTSGEQRISNFLLWQLAYSELYFTNVMWPDFAEEDLEAALLFYANRERRFGFISEQIQ